MGGFLGIGGSSAKTDRRTQLTGYGELEKIFNFAMPQAQTLGGAGTGALSQSQQYWQNLLSGNRPAMMQAVAPETNIVQSQADAARRRIAALGTARGGGTASTEEATKTDEMAKIDNLLFGARPAAAGELTRIGGTELEAALRALGISGAAAGELTETAMKSRALSYDINRQAQADVFSAIGDIGMVLGVA